jgi:hypothetical protein
MHAIKCQEGASKWPSLSTNRKPSGCLKTALNDALEESHPRGLDSFLPLDELMLLVNPASIRQELDGYSFFTEKKDKKTDRKRNKVRSLIRSENQLRKLGERVCSEQTSCRKLFAILVLVEMAWWIKHIMKEKISDSDLPLRLCKVNDKLQLLRRGVDNRQASAGRRAKHKKHHASEATEEGIVGPSPSIKCFRKWTERQLRDFYDKQWMVIAPFFNRGEDPNRPVLHMKLNNKAILPYLSWDTVKSGGFGEVSRVTIHNEHQTFSKPSVSKSESILASLQLVLR